MKTLVILLFMLIALVIPAYSTPNYVTLTDDCPVVTFSEANLSKISTYKCNVKVQLTTSNVIVSLTNYGAQTFTWNEAQATAYGSRTLAQLYAYFLTIIEEPCP